MSGETVTDALLGGKDSTENYHTSAVAIRTVISGGDASDHDLVNAITNTASGESTDALQELVEQQGKFLITLLGPESSATVRLGTGHHLAQGILGISNFALEYYLTHDLLKKGIADEKMAGFFGGDPKVWNTVLQWGGPIPNSFLNGFAITRLINNITRLVRFLGCAPDSYKGRFTIALLCSTVLGIWGAVGSGTLIYDRTESPWNIVALAGRWILSSLSATYFFLQVTNKLSPMVMLFRDSEINAAFAEIKDFSQRLAQGVEGMDTAASQEFISALTDFYHNRDSLGDEHITAVHQAIKNALSMDDDDSLLETQEITTSAGWPHMPSKRIICSLSMLFFGWVCVEIYSQVGSATVPHVFPWDEVSGPMYGPQRAAFYMEPTYEFASYLLDAGADFFKGLFNCSAEQLFPLMGLMAAVLPAMGPAAQAYGLNKYTESEWELDALFVAQTSTFAYAIQQAAKSVTGLKLTKEEEQRRMVAHLKQLPDHVRYYSGADICRLRDELRDQDWVPHVSDSESV